jgi:hypothetical protein
LRRIAFGASGAVVLLSAGASLSTGCFLVTDLNSDPYHLASGGAAGGQCGADASADASCPLVFSAGACAASCPSTQVCCVTPTNSGAIDGQCLDPSTCSNQATSTALCNPGNPCTNGDPCMAETCTYLTASVTVYACTLIPPCKAL